MFGQSGYDPMNEMSHDDSLRKERAGFFIDAKDEDARQEHEMRSREYKKDPTSKNHNY